MSDGQHLTLNPLRRKRAPDYLYKSSKSDGVYTYHFNLCAPAIMTCNGEEDAIALQRIGDDCQAILARGGPTEARYIQQDNPKKGVILRYDGGDACLANNRRVEFVLKCDHNVEFETEDVEETETCLYTFTIRTKYT